MANVNVIIGEFKFSGKKIELTDQVTKVALGELKATSAKNAKKADKIYEKVRELYPKIEDYLSLDVLRTYLSTLSRQESSTIYKEPGQHGYFLKEEEKDEDNSVDNQKEFECEGHKDVQEESDAKAYRKIEEQIYPILENWLSSQGYRAQVTASMRDRSLGLWGNPDITGINICENLGNKEVEIVTVEAKPSVKEFQKLIFEAIAHRRFANKSYYAFAAESSFLMKNNELLRYYSELFNVGVIVVAMEDKKFQKYVEGTVAQLNSDEVDVYELFSPKYEHKQNKWQKEYLMALDIKDEQSLWLWGSNSID